MAKKRINEGKTRPPKPTEKGRINRGTEKLSKTKPPKPKKNN